MTLFSVTFSCTRCRSRRRHPTSSNCASSIPSHLPLALMERRIALPSPAEHPEPPASVCRNAFFPHKNHHPTRLRSTPVCRRLAHHRSSLAPQSLRARQPQTAYWLRKLFRFNDSQRGLTAATKFAPPPP